jgi:uncharacterized membrane protein
MAAVKTYEPGADEAWPSPLERRWPWMVGPAVSVLGLGVTGYLTYEHYTASTTLNCPAGGGIVDCLKVTTSQYAAIHGVPVAVLGLIFFGVMIMLQSRRAWAQASLGVRAGRLLWSLAGVGIAIWLVYAELFKLHAICMWCTAVHVMALLLFGLTAFGTAVTGSFAEADTDDQEPHRLEVDLNAPAGQGTSGGRVHPTTWPQRRPSATGGRAHPRRTGMASRDR